MKRLFLLLFIAICLTPMTVEYSHDGVCECDGLNNRCPKIFTEKTTLVGYLSEDLDYIEDISIGW